MKHLTTPLTGEVIKNLKAGESVLITGTIYTLRDAGHKKMTELMAQGIEPAIELKGQIIYYAGPSPAKPGNVIGSAGPTTSGRMDAYAPILLDKGLSGMIGKGERNQAVIDSMVKNKAVYFAAVGGAAALIADSIKEAKVIDYEELGTEALRELKVVDFPCIVVIDSEGNNLYKSEKAKYRL